MSGGVRVDLSQVEKRFSESSLRKKQAEFAKRVAFEMRAYVPEDAGTLRDSEPLSSDYEGGTIEWQTPYARRVHDLPQSSIKTTKNPRARAAWPEAAKGERLESWRSFAAALMKE